GGQQPLDLLPLPPPAPLGGQLGRAPGGEGRQDAGAGRLAPLTPPPPAGPPWPRGRPRRPRRPAPPPWSGGRRRPGCAAATTCPTPTAPPPPSPGPPGRRRPRPLRARTVPVAVAYSLTSPAQATSLGKAQHLRQVGPVGRPLGHP